LSTRDTLEVVEREMRTALAFHLDEGIAGDSDPIPDPSGRGVYLERGSRAA
jgi:hypothetical protein